MGEEAAAAGEEVTVLSVKKSYSYTIPSFAAITLRLRHVLIRVEEKTGPVIMMLFSMKQGSVQTSIMFFQDKL